MLWPGGLRSSIAASGFVIGVLAFALVPAEAEAQSDLVVWVTPTDAEFFRDGVEQPTKIDIERFLRSPQQFFWNECSRKSDKSDCERLSDQIDVGVTQEALQEPSFASQVLGQQLLLRGVSSFINKDGFRGRVLIRFLEWNGLLGLLESVSGTAPDIVVAPSTWVAYLARRGVLQSLDGLPGIDTSRYPDRVLQTVQAPADPPSSELRLYALPWLPDVRFLFYWKKDFEGARFGNRDQFVKGLEIAGGNTVSKGIPPLAFPTAPDWDLLHTWSLLFYGQGGSWDANGDFLPEAESGEVVKFLERLRSANLAGFWEMRRVQLEEKFLAHEVSSIVSGLWLLRRLASVKGGYEAVGFVLPPFNVEGVPQVTYLGGVHLGLTRAGIDDQFARKLLVHLTQDTLREEARRSDPWARVPLVLADEEAKGAVFARLPPEARSEIDTALASGRYPPRIPEWATEVENQSTRFELFLIFKLIAQGEDALRDVAYRKLTELRNRLNVGIYKRPANREGIGAARWLLVFAAFMLGLFARQALPLQRIMHFLSDLRRGPSWKREVNVAKAQPVTAADQTKLSDGRSESARADDSVATGHQHTANLGVVAQARAIAQRTATVATEDVSAKTKQPGTGNKPFPKRERPYLFPQLALIFDGAARSLRTPRMESAISRNTPAADASSTIIGDSLSIRTLREEIESVLKSDAFVLITGETGTGKELVARSIHYGSIRKTKPFVAINCAALPETLLESELFGIEPGTATGVRGKPGKFEEANYGTLLLDEIGDMTLPTQAKILRVLADGRLSHVGGRGTIKVDVRVIAATNKSLESQIKEGRFREDLYFRLNVIPISVPPLRDRKTDIPLLIEHFLKRYEAKVTIDQDAHEVICGPQWQWSGNVRQLGNLVERWVRRASRRTGTNGEITIKVDDVKEDYRELMRGPQEDASGGASCSALELAPRLMELDDFAPFWKCAVVCAEELDSFYDLKDSESSVSRETQSRRQSGNLDDVLRHTYERIPIKIAKPTAQVGADCSEHVLVQRAEEEPNDLNLAFLYDLLEAVLNSRGRLTGSVRKKMSEQAKRDVSEIRRRLLFGEDKRREFEQTWREIPLKDIAFEVASEIKLRGVGTEPSVR